MGKKIMILVLENHMNNQHELYRMKKSDYLRFLIGHTIQGKHIRLFTNYPMHSNIFLRGTYHELEIINPTPSKNKYDSFDNYGELKVTLSGAFQFYFTEDGSSEITNKIGEGYFIIDPRFTFESLVKNTSRNWDLDGLVVQTYLSKNLGKFPDWEKRISAALNGNYNMIHFTPLQELGGSRSAYSLRHQLMVNPWFSTESQTVTWNDIDKFIKGLNDKYHCLSMTDLVYNHTSNDSPWLHEHPECAYNVVNSPYLRPAYLLDRAVWNLTIDISNYKFSGRGLLNVVNQANHVNLVRVLLLESIQDMKLHEFYMANVENAIGNFRKFLEDVEKSTDRESFFKVGDLVFQHGKYERLQSQVDHGVLAKHFFEPLGHIEAACNKYRTLLEGLNDQMRSTVQSHIEAAVNNVMANVNYRFMDPHGLKLKVVSAETPIMWNYFYHPNPAVVTLKDCELKMDGEQRIMAFNGWVMNHDPLSNFAEESSNVYLRRELIVWGDSVKLRYGNGPEDCPFLWSHMLKYTDLTAQIFHAVRLDNCHSTPIHVAQAMLDRARAVCPDLYIVAELFTGSEAVDNIFVNKLGINSLIREAQSAWNCQEQGRLVFKYGGLPIGAFVQQSPQHLQPSTAHALFYDMTHDNDSPVCKRSPFDLVPSSAMVGMACCAIGSTRGYDEMVPHYIDVVNEERFYSSWGDQIGLDSSIVRFKSIINKLHHRMAAQYFNEVFVDQLDDDVVAITRLSPTIYRSVVMVAHTAFKYPGHRPGHRHVREVRLSGKVRNILIESRTVRNERLLNDFKKDPFVINGLPGVVAKVYENLEPKESSMITVTKDQETHNDIIHFKNFPAGSVIAFEVEMTEEHIVSIEKLKVDLAMHFNAKLRSGSTGQCLVNELMVEEQLSKSLLSKSKDKEEVGTVDFSLRELLGELSLNELNRLLYRCHEEELAEFSGCGCYELPDYGRLVFCGLQGIMSVLVDVHKRNDLGHPLCENLRRGDWLLDYVCDRLERYSDSPLGKVGLWFRIMFAPLRKLPRFMLPTYFDMIISCSYKLALEECYYQLGDDVIFGSNFVKSLALGSVMLCSEMRNCKMPPISIKLTKSRCSMSAGFPHFAEGIWRNWGRDTFISLRGLTILTNRFEEARSIILTYAATVRHGLIPNLLGDGLLSRYNARDATWFWLNSIKEYEISQSLLDENNAQSVLDMPVARMYASDNADGSQIVQQRLVDVMQEVLQRHSDGIRFHERNAGPQIDEHMQAPGFLVKAGLRNSTKFPYGGNEFNCGTWMDKMGSSYSAGNKGRPATPRDGSAVELVGLCASVLEWLIGLSNSQKLIYPGIKCQGETLKWSDWYASIKEFFDDMYFIPLDATDSQLISNRGIYRDTINSNIGYTDSQFRPNFLIAMTVAPSLFNQDNAWYALNLVEKELLGPLGMRTLSPRDWAYRGYYDNSNDSNDPSVSHGFNYHQGPEWVWLTGYYLRAKLIFSQKIYTSDPYKYHTVVTDTIRHVTEVLGRLYNHINHSRWRSLPELTNKDGQFCYHSCEAQAWSIASTFEAMHDLISLDK